MLSRTESAPPTNSLILPARPSAFATFHAEGASPMFHSLIARFPMVDTEHFKNIRDNKFKVENIIKLSTEYESVQPKNKYLRIGSTEVEYREEDALASDARGITHLLRAFLIYCQIVIHIAHAGTQMELQAAMHVYIDQLLGWSLLYTFESIRQFHFGFHKSRLVEGVDDPRGWRTPNRGSEERNLRRKIDYNAGPDLRRTQSTNSLVQRMSSQDDQRGIAACRRYNNGGDWPSNCTFRQVCASCGRQHTQRDCRMRLNPYPPQQSKPS